MFIEEKNQSKCMWRSIQIVVHQQIICIMYGAEYASSLDSVHCCDYFAVLSVPAVVTVTISVETQTNVHCCCYHFVLYQHV